MIIKPQKGFQEQFLSSPADIVIGGSGAGVGKSFALLIEPIRHSLNARFNALIFRRTYAQITQTGSLWDKTQEIYPVLNAKPNATSLDWTFPSGSVVSFGHLQHEKDKFNYQGTEICMIGFDELTHFTESMFFYLLSRNRSTCGVRPYIRATCNPDPDSWVARFIEWWIDKDTGYPIKERIGKLRYFTRTSNIMVWGSSVDEVYDKTADSLAPFIEKGARKEDLIKSVSFIPGSIHDNEELLKKDPGYLANLNALGDNEKAALLDGNWKFRTSNDDLFKPDKLMDLSTNSFVKMGQRCGTGDVALHGSDKFVLMAWAGWVIIDIRVISKSDGKEVIDHITEFCRINSIPLSNFVYDSDGVGNFIRGFLKQCKAFNNGAAPINRGKERTDLKNKPNYKNLKTQCYYGVSRKVNDSEIYISENIDPDVVDQIRKELRAHKKHKPDHDGKLQITPKEMVKEVLGHSPDLADAFMMRYYIELKPGMQLF